MWLMFGSDDEEVTVARGQMSDEPGRGIKTATVQCNFVDI
jgi:hypothetical protein